MIDSYEVRIVAGNIMVKCICGYEYAEDEHYCYNCGRERRVSLLKKTRSQLEKNQDKNLIICPYCGKQMEYGFIKSHNPLNWVEPGQGFFQRSYQITSEGSSFKLFSGHKIKSYRCTKCQTIIINYL